MAINWSTVATGLSNALALVEELAPAAAVAGPEGAAIGAVVGKVAEVADSLLNLANAAGPVIASNDLATIQAAATKIAASNNALAAQIVTS